MQLKEEEVYFGSQLRVGRSWQQERESAGHVAPPVVTKQEMNASLICLSFSVELQPTEWCAPHLWGGPSHFS